MIIPNYLYWIVLAVWGLALGSFTTCVLYRVPRRISLWQRQDGSHRSFCPQCKTPLGPPDLMPVLSWVIQGGACRHCGKKIPAFYPLVELIVMIGALGLGWVFFPSVWVFAWAFILPLGAGFYGFLCRI